MTDCKSWQGLLRAWSGLRMLPVCPLTTLRIGQTYREATWYTGLSRNGEIKCRETYQNRGRFVNASGIRWVVNRFMGDLDMEGIGFPGVADQVFTEVPEPARFGDQNLYAGLDGVLVPAAFDQSCNRLPV